MQNNKKARKSGPFLYLLSELLQNNLHQALRLKILNRFI